MAYDPLIGAQLGHFQVEKLIAEGGMGVIYQATHTVIGRRAAIKVLSEKYSSDQNMIKRLHREARAVNRIGHPNIIDVFNFGRTADNREYFVMEYLPGQTLAQVQEKTPRIPWSLASQVLAQSLDALAAAHDLDIVHRDIKPENILIVPQDAGGVLVKLLDFGIAKSIGLGPEGEQLTRAGSVMGTPEYIAPEQIRGREVDGRADLYAMGVILFEMVMGRRPFESDKVINLLMMHLREPVPRMDDIPPELGVPRFVPAVVNKAMAKDPDQRFPDARTFARALGLETSAVAPSDGTRPLPELFWEKGEPPSGTPTLEDAVPEGLPRAPLATRPGPAVSPAPSLPGVTSSPSLPTDVIAHRPAASAATAALRWVLPIALLLLSGSAILFYFALRPAPQGRGTTTGSSGEPVRAGTGVREQPARDREVDLQALAQSVRLLLRSGVASSSPDARRLCLRGLGAIRDADALGLVRSALRDDPERAVRAGAALAMADLGDPAAVAALREARPQADEPMKVWIDDALMRLGQADGVLGLKEALKSADKAVRFQAALALGEAGNPAAIPALQEVAATPDVSKETAVTLLSTLARLGHEESSRSLQKALDAPDPVIQLGAAEGLLRMGSDAALVRLKELSRSDRQVVRLVASKLLATTGDYSGLAGLREGLRARDEPTRRLAAEGMGAVSHKAALAPLADALEDSSWVVKAAAAESLARILSLMPTAVIQRGQDWLMSALANRDWSVRHAAVGATSEMDPELAVNLLGWAYKDKDPRVRMAAVARLEQMRTRKAVPLLASALGDESEEVRGRAAQALGRIADPSARAALQAATRDKSHTVRAAAAGSLLAQGDMTYLRDLREAARSRSSALRRASIAALSRWPDPQADALLLGALKDKDPGVRFAAARGLALRGKEAGIAELRRALGKGGEEERQALAALTALGVKPVRELAALAGSPSAESRRAAMEHTAVLDRDRALEILRAGARDSDPTVRAEAAGALARLAGEDSRARALLRALARDPDPAVRTRAGLALARLSKAGAALDMGEVKPVREPELRPPPSPAPTSTPGKRSDSPRPLFVDDRSPQQLYMYHSVRATVAAARGDYEGALGHLRAAQKQRDEPPLLFEFGMVHLRMALQPNRQPESARAHLASAKSYFESYLRRAPGGRLAGKARKGLKDVERIAKVRGPGR